MSLPRGLNKLPRDVVEASQRTRIKQAMAESVASKGYAATTVTDLTSLAGVSRTTFYEQFTDKEDCYLVCFEDQIRYLIKRMKGAIDKNAPPPAQFVQTLAAFIDTLAAQPVYSMAYMGLSGTAGAKVLEALPTHKARIIKVLQSIHARSLAYRVDTKRLPGELFDMTIHGTYEFMCVEIRSGRVAALGKLLPQICYMWFSVLGYPAWASAALNCTPAELRARTWSEVRRQA